jgi:hypothetical protein
MDRCAEEGRPVVALTMPMIVGMNMSFLTYCALNMMPDWGRSSGCRSRSAWRSCGPRDPSLHGRASRLARGRRVRADSPAGTPTSSATPTPRPTTGSPVAASATSPPSAAQPFDTLLDIVLEDDLRTVLWPGATDADDESWELRRQAWDHPSVMLGGSDAGAHLDRMQGANYPTRSSATASAAASSPRSSAPCR